MNIPDVIKPKSWNATFCFSLKSVDQNSILTYAHTRFLSWSIRHIMTQLKLPGVAIQNKSQTGVTALMTKILQRTMN